MTIPFTAARARNAGWRRMAAINPGLHFIQFLDGDCELNSDWLRRSIHALIDEDALAAVFGRRRERYAHASIYNRMCDDEWNTPVGIAEACGGDALFRLDALQMVGGYSETLIAGEEPDLCLRLRHKGWKLRRLDAEMTLHDAAITSFRAFWKRTERSGFAYAEHVWRHGKSAIPSWRRQLYGIVFWGLLIPSVVLVCSVIFAFSGAKTALLAAMVALTVYPLQIARVAAKKACTSDLKFARLYAILIVVGKVPQGIGALRCWIAHVLRRHALLIEYKVS
jgi:GT2 family glycosyltransferase